MRQREYQAELEEIIRQLAEATGTQIDYTKVEQAAKAGAKAALAEGIDIDAQAEITFHETSQDKVTD